MSTPKKSSKRVKRVKFSAYAVVGESGQPIEVYIFFAGAQREARQLTARTGRSYKVVFFPFTLPQ